MHHQLLRFLLDMPLEPTAAEKFKKNPYPLIIGGAAFVALIVWYVYRMRKKKKDQGPAQQG